MSVERDRAALPFPLLSSKHKKDKLIISQAMALDALLSRLEPEISDSSEGSFAQEKIHTSRRP